MTAHSLPSSSQSVWIDDPAPRLPEALGRAPCRCGRRRRRHRGAHDRRAARSRGRRRGRARSRDDRARHDGSHDGEDLRPAGHDAVTARSAARSRGHRGLRGSAAVSRGVDQREGRRTRRAVPVRTAGRVDLHDGCGQRRRRRARSGGRIRARPRRCPAHAGRASVRGRSGGDHAGPGASSIPTRISSTSRPKSQEHPAVRSMSSAASSGSATGRCRQRMAAYGPTMSW